MICSVRRSCVESQSSMNPALPKIRNSLGWGRVVLVLILTGVVAAQKNPALDGIRHALDQGDTTQAIAELEHYRRTHSTDAEVYNLLGIAYGRAGDNERSLAMFKEFARLAPNTPAAYNNLGAAYLRQDNPEQAEVAFRHALRILSLIHI